MYELPIKRINKIIDLMHSEIHKTDLKSHIFARYMTLLLSGHYWEAFEVYRYYINISGYDEKYEKVILLISTELLKLGEYSKANEILKVGISEFPTNEGIVNNYAVSLAKQSKYEQSLAILNKAVKKFPNSIKIKNNLNKINNYLCEMD